jgi:polygalacturonase
MAQRYEITESVSAVALVAIAGGVLVPGASATATIKDLSANNLTVYAAETGVTTATNPITTDAFGRIEGWVESPDYDIVVSGVTSYTQRVRQSPSAVFNVKSYGAKGDGTTNDTTAIQAALDAANSAGGGEVRLPSGTYKITTALVPYSKVAIVGAGAGATIFAPSGGIHCFQRGGGVGTELTS